MGASGSTSDFGGDLSFGTSSGVFNGDFTTTDLDEAGVLDFGLPTDLEPAEVDFGVDFFSAGTSFGVRF